MELSSLHMLPKFTYGSIFHYGVLSSVPLRSEVCPQLLFVTTIELLLSPLLLRAPLTCAVALLRGPPTSADALHRPRHDHASPLLHRCAHLPYRENITFLFWI
jgi:hypothetical protein